MTRRWGVLALVALLPWQGAGAQETAGARGEAVYTRICAMCHSPTGPATVTLAARLGADRAPDDHARR